MKLNTYLEKIQKDLDEIQEQYGIRNFSLSEREELERQRELCESSFYEFVKAAWPVLEGREKPFIDNWHIKALCDHFQATTTRQIKKLIVNLPPRTSKSSVEMLFVPWVWCRNPRESFMFVSYSQDVVAMRDARKCRDIILSTWYQRLWGHKVKLRKDANTLKIFYNMSGGWRQYASFGANITGSGTSYIIFSDPNDKESIFSSLARQRTNDEYDAGFSTRLEYPASDSPFSTVRIIGQQRLHMQDLSGWVLSKDNGHEWINLRLPMEYDDNKPCVTVPLIGTHGLPWRDPRTEKGQLLFPQYWDKKAVTDLKAELRTTLNIQTQLQQAPANEEGNIFKRDWWKIWQKSFYPTCNHVVMSWDTSFGGQDGSYSACTVWGIYDHPENDIPNIILLNAWRGRVIFPDLREIVKRMCRNYYDTNFDYDPPPEILEPDTIIIEAKATGSPLIDELARAGIMAIPFDPGKEGRYIKKQNQKFNPKELRAHHVSSIVQAGKCWLPAKHNNPNILRSFASEFMEAACAFPAAGTTDYVDSMSQAFLWIKKSRAVWMPTDEPPMDDRDSAIWKAISVEKGNVY